MASNGTFSDAFSEVFDNTAGVVPPIVGRKGLRHFRAAHFSKLRYFWCAHIAGIEVEIEVLPPGNAGGTRAADIGTYVPLRGKRVIVVRLKKDGEIWESYYEVDDFTAETAEQIIAIIKKVGKQVDDITVKVKQVGINIVTPVIKVFKKNKDE